MQAARRFRAERARAHVPMCGGNPQATFCSGGGTNGKEPVKEGHDPATASFSKQSQDAQHEPQSCFNKLPSFDQSCTLSSGSDCTLKFPFGTALRTHRLILSQWSSVLAEALQLETSGELHMPKSASIVWRVLLSHMYPVELDMGDFDLEFVMDVADEANEYGIRHVETKMCNHLLKFVKDCPQPQLFRMTEIASKCNANGLLALCKDRIQEVVINHMEFGNANTLLHDICKDIRDNGQQWPSTVLADLLCAVIQRGSKLLAESRHCLQAEVQRSASLVADGRSLADEKASSVSLKKELMASQKRVAELESIEPGPVTVLKKRLVDSQKRTEKLKACIANAGCFVSLKGNLCSVCTNRPIRHGD